MKENCKPVIDHLKRLQGQLNTFQKYLEEGRDCHDVLHLAISATKSFDSLKAKVVEGFIKEEVLEKKELGAENAELLAALMKLVKS